MYNGCMINNLSERFKALSPFLTEKTRRLVAAAECMGGSRGVKGEVSRETGVSYREIRRGLVELKKGIDGSGKMKAKTRLPGGGRKSAKENDPELVVALKELVEPSTLGDPCRPLLYTSKSLRSLADALKAKGHKISHVTVGELLKDMGYTQCCQDKINIL